MTDDGGGGGAAGKAHKRRLEVVVAGHRGDAAAAERRLDDDDAGVRAAALGALARCGVLRAEQVRRALVDEAAAVRCRAAELAPDEVELVDLLSDPDPSVVEVVAAALGERDQDPGSVGELCRVARGHEDPLCRESAVAALGAIAAGLDVEVGSPGRDAEDSGPPDAVAGSGAESGPGAPHEAAADSGAVPGPGAPHEAAADSESVADAPHEAAADSESVPGAPHEAAVGSGAVPLPDVPHEAAAGSGAEPLPDVPHEAAAGSGAEPGPGAPHEVARGMALEVLLTAMDDRPQIRRRALLGLHQFDDDRAADAVRAALEDRDRQVRAVAGELLGVLVH